MTPISQPERIEQCFRLLTSMMKQDEPWQFNEQWIRQLNWEVVPVESMARLPPSEIPRLASVLRGFSEQCSVLVVDDLGELPRYYRVPVSEDGLSQVNRELGMFRFVLTDDARTWAISCAEWCNLFAAPTQVLEEILGKSLDSARAEFVRFASDLGDQGLLRLVEYHRSS